MWLKKKVQFDKFIEPGAGQQEPEQNESQGGKPNVKRQYLMSD